MKTIMFGMTGVVLCFAVGANEGDLQSEFSTDSENSAAMHGVYHPQSKAAGSSKKESSLEIQIELEVSVDDGGGDNSPS